MGTVSIGKMNQQLGNREEAWDEWQRLQVEGIIHNSWTGSSELIQNPASDQVSELLRSIRFRSIFRIRYFLICAIQYQQLNERGNP